MSLPARFVKMAGGGNDFLIFEADGRALTEEDRRRLALACRRGLSVGADGALFLSPGEKGRAIFVLAATTACACCLCNMAAAIS